MTKINVEKINNVITLKCIENKNIKDFSFKDDGSDLNNSKISMFLVNLVSQDDQDYKFINSENTDDETVLFIIDLFTNMMEVYNAK